MNNTTAQTTQRNWQEIIANLQRLSESGESTIEIAKRYEAFSKTAEQIQALVNNNGSEAEKEAFFAPVERFYCGLLETEARLKDAIAKDEEKARKLKEQQAKIKAENENERWKKLPFYVRDSYSDLICIESRQTLEDKFSAISCMFDSLKAIPQLLEMGLLEEGKSGIVERLTEMSKLYLMFADEQFSLLADEIQGGKYGKLENKGDLC
ncbi:hypothetical protein [Mannheimia haemolytica]|uniref:hypothetical protein n=1 Tax=Mannheimia haemolytica TaxID=75985 RepID=UPI0001BCF8F9|nr:hypothetical protein [Mannheimia haemolytica]EEY12689.1 hypothetical protein COK_1272 [Mannheimia haemolytica serotype A2 str. BOVINE]MDW0723514.1 hypothetical protein [Mannheimia haemolytica]MDW0736545.1 hypothetical protein [Mannheimia haemolytica]TRC14848.1 hypothetical protein FEA50_05150 [Mannheimia haemolytica]TRC67420.1 hypothetical protein FEA31_05310 [Mannheimia haemolytica]